MRAVLVAGDGAVARALAASLDEGGVTVRRWWRASGQEIAAADVIVLAVSDRAIAEVARELVSAQPAPAVLLHCAGALAPDEPFAGLPRTGAALWHPLTSVAADGQRFAGVAFGVAGDEAGRGAAIELTRAVGGVPLSLPSEPDALARYHAAAALVANHSVGLVDAGVELFETLGVGRETATHALAALLASTARNLATVGLPAALTGPIARGDEPVVVRHLAALAPTPELDALYRATARRVTKVAADKGRAPADALARLRALLFDGLGH